VIHLRWVGSACLILDVDGSEVAVRLGSSLVRQLTLLRLQRGQFVEIRRVSTSITGRPEYEIRRKPGSWRLLEKQRREA
jgi:hypothetical protein